MLFLIFINDLLEVLEVCVKLFADETKIYKQITCYEDTQSLQRSVTSAVKWVKDWDMEFNDEKCHHLHIGNHEFGQSYTMETFDGEREIKKVSSKKDLGVTIDKNLTFREHISTKINIANTNLGIISRTFTYLDPEMFQICI